MVSTFECAGFYRIQIGKFELEPYTRSDVEMQTKAASGLYPELIMYRHGR